MALTGSEPGTAVEVADDHPAPYYRTPTPDEPKSLVTPITLAVLIVGVGVALSLSAFGWVDLTVTRAVGGAVAIIGIGLLASFFGGKPIALLPLGLLLTLIIMGAAVGDSVISDGVGTKTYSPASNAQLKDSYVFGAGEFTVDLSKIELDDEDIFVAVELDFGEMTVIVPEEMPIDVVGENRFGELRVFDESEDGVNVDIEYSSVTGDEPHLVLDLEMFAGQGNVQND